MHRFVAASVFTIASAVAQSNFPAPPAPPTNPPTPQKELLGMALFFEEQMSATNTVACATCHDFGKGGVDARTALHANPGADGVLGTADDQHGSAGVSVLFQNMIAGPHPTSGYGPQVTRRRAPTVVNAGYHLHLAYDGSSSTLEELIAKPPINPTEMGYYGRTWTNVEQKIAASAPLRLASNLPARLQNFIGSHTYPDLFQAAFGTPVVTSQRIIQAIAVYIRTLNSDQSKWDLHLHNQATLTPQEQQGLALFTSPANGATSCNTCHGDFDTRVLMEGPIAGQMTMTPSGPYGSLFPMRLEFHNVGVRPIAEDQGRGGITGVATDFAKFRVASLRNVELTGPYFHNGSKATLRDVLDFYDRGGDFHANQAANLTPRNYTVAEKDAIIALLRTLTDPRLAAGLQPFDRPMLAAENGRLVSSFGRGATTNSGPLTAAAPFAPLLGEQHFQLGMTGATVGAFTFLMWDVAPGSGSSPFNVLLGLTPAFAMFPTGQAQWNFLSPQSGAVQVQLPLPNAPSLGNQVLFAQWVALEPTANAPFATSNALRVPLQ